MALIRLGVVGLGLIWLREHLPVLATLSDVFVPIAFCDVSAERRADAAAAFPHAPVLADFRQLLAFAEVDAVLVLTPIALNAPVALAALQAGKDVIMEKPIARSVAEGQQLVAAARAAGRRLFVAEQMAYRHTEAQLAALLSAGEIGELILWNRIQHVDLDPAQGALRYDTTPWRKHADYPLGPLFDGGIHVIASLNKIFGRPESVCASGRRLRPEYGDYDQVAMVFHYGNGAVGFLSHSNCLPPMQNFFHLHGSAGVITVEPDRFVIEKGSQPARVIELAAENARLQMWQSFAQAFQTKNEPDYSPERALQDVAILETVDQSIKRGQRLPIINLSQQPNSTGALP